MNLITAGSPFKSMIRLASSSVYGRISRRSVADLLDEPVTARRSAEKVGIEQRKTDHGSKIGISLIRDRLCGRVTPTPQDQGVYPGVSTSTATNPKPMPVLNGSMLTRFTA